MGQTIIAEGKTSTEAIEKGLRELNISKEQAEIKILEEKKKSFFSILDPHVVRVEISVKEGVVPKQKKEAKKAEIDTENVEIIKKDLEGFLNKFLLQISSDISYDIKVEREHIFIELFGKGSTKLIGYRGEALNSLQLILSNIASKSIENQIKVILDIGNYREKRKNTLEELAVKIEKTVKKTGKKVTLEPMTPYERKIIHTKLQESEYVKTYSIGEEANRRIVVSKK